MSYCHFEKWSIGELKKIYLCGYYFGDLAIKKNSFEKN
jgi:hypothetical protein